MSEAADKSFHRPKPLSNLTKKSRNQKNMNEFGYDRNVSKTQMNQTHQINNFNFEYNYKHAKKNRQNLNQTQVQNLNEIDKFSDEFDWHQPKRRNENTNNMKMSHSLSNLDRQNQNYSKNVDMRLSPSQMPLIEGPNQNVPYPPEDHNGGTKKRKIKNKAYPNQNL